MISLKRISKLATCLVVSVAYVLNFVNTTHLSNLTKSRDFQYYAWQEITRNTDFFNQVKNRDILIAWNQDDSYEYNAGSFYSNTGIRLAYFYKTNVLLPDLENCTVAENCEMPNLLKTINSTLPNLSRVSKINPNDSKSDWVINNIQPGALEKIQIWATDSILLTTSDIFMYLIEFDHKVSATTLNFGESTGVLISKEARSFSPSIGGICMNLVSKSASKLNPNWEVTFWNMGGKAVTPAGVEVERRKKLDYRVLDVGTCAK